MGEGGRYHRVEGEYVGFALYVFWRGGGGWEGRDLI